MQGIFDAITDFFTSIFEIISFVFRGLFLLFKVLFVALEMLINLIGLLPTPFIIGGVALVVICVLLKVLGRESSG